LKTPVQGGGDHEALHQGQAGTKTAVGRGGCFCAAQHKGRGGGMYMRLRPNVGRKKYEQGGTPGAMSAKGGWGGGNRHTFNHPGARVGTGARPARLLVIGRVQAWLLRNRTRFTNPRCSWTPVRFSRAAKKFAGVGEGCGGGRSLTRTCAEKNWFSFF